MPLGETYTDEHFVEELGLLFAELGQPRMMGRMLAWLLICEPPDQSSSDLVGALGASKATISTGQFEHRVRQAALLTNEESRGVRLAFAPEAATLTSRAPEAGEAEVTCPIKYDGEQIEIAFNPSFLLEALRVVAGDEVVLELSAANKPAVLKAGSDFLYVLMPVDLG